MTVANDREVSMILALRGAGYGARLIARYLGIPYHKASVRRIDALARKGLLPAPAPIPSDVFEKIGPIQRCTNEERFLKYAQKTDGCWLWKASIDRHGYGRALIDGKRVGAHRAAWALFKGEIPAGMQVLHRCDVPRCVNPEHLFLGTGFDNMQDMIAKGRAPHIKNPVATPEKIKYVIASKEPGSAICRVTGLSRSTVQKIKDGTHWMVRSNQSTT